MERKKGCARWSLLVGLAETDFSFGAWWTWYLQFTELGMGSPYEMALAAQNWARSPLGNLAYSGSEFDQSFLLHAIVLEAGGCKTYTFSWSDRLLHGQNISTLVPHVFALVSKRTVNKRTAYERFSVTWEGSLILEEHYLSGPLQSILINGTYLLLFFF